MKIPIMKVLSIASILFAIIYIVMPIDFDGPIIGIIDDFFVFMAAFCFCQAQFLKPEKYKAKHLLNLIALIFACLSLIWLMILAFTPILEMVA